MAICSKIVRTTQSDSGMTVPCQMGLLTCTLRTVICMCDGDGDCNPVTGLQGSQCEKIKINPQRRHRQNIGVACSDLVI